jgi:hypothetical protein
MNTLINYLQSLSLIQWVGIGGLSLLIIVLFILF